jgi:hypothetical protein
LPCPAEIAENDYNFPIPRYRDRDDFEEEEIDTMSIIDKRLPESGEKSGIIVALNTPTIPPITHTALEKLKTTIYAPIERVYIQPFNCILLDNNNS